MVLSLPDFLPTQHAAFLRGALPVLQGDARIVGVTAGGSYLSGDMDDFSDLDLVIAVESNAFPAVLAERQEIAAKLGPPLLAAFTGEHVGEPRLLICLYDGPPPLHVDLKFVALPDVAKRVEDPAVLWERDGRVTKALGGGEAAFPHPDLQWIEDRFWVWLHYGTLKLGRGELLEAIDFLAYLRGVVLGPLLLMEYGKLPRGVRRVETDAAPGLPEMLATLPTYERAAVAGALRDAAAMYRRLRELHAPASLVQRAEAERAALAYLEEVA